MQPDARHRKLTQVRKLRMQRQISLLDHIHGPNTENFLHCLDKAEKRAAVLRKRPLTRLPAFRAKRVVILLGQTLPAARSLAPPNSRMDSDVRPCAALSSIYLFLNTHSSIRAYIWFAFKLPWPRLPLRVCFVHALHSRFLVVARAATAEAVRRARGAPVAWSHWIRLSCRGERARAGSACTVSGLRHR